MLSVQANEEICKVGAGTPMGELMRRYWQPIAASGELNENPTKSVRILGENLTLYKDRSGTLGLIDESCPHRRVNLLYGIPEEHGLRCPYHGWLMNETGQCIEMPAEAPDSTFKDRVQVRAYPVQELGGLVFAYMGPEPAPLLPRWDILVWDNVMRDIAFTELDCNWLQCMENSLDSTHTEWLHNYYANYVRDRRREEGANVVGVDGSIYAEQEARGELIGPSTANPGATRATSGDRNHHMKIGYDLFEYGIYKRRIYEGGTEEDASWRRGHPILSPNILRVGNSFQYRIPRDDGHTLHILYTPHIPPEGVEAPVQDTVPYYDTPLTDSKGGWFITDWIFGQDFMAWATQGNQNGGLAERHLEKLAESDKGIILYRRMLKEQMKVVADGGEPMGVVREEHDFIPILTENAPPEWTFKDPERQRKQAEKVSTPSKEGTYGRGGDQARRMIGAGQQRYDQKVVRELNAMYEKQETKQS